MNSYNNQKRKSIIIVTAIITLVVFAVIIFAVFNPLKFYRITHITNNFDTSQDFVKFLNVGQGDCALIYSNGYSAVIDVGMSNTANDISQDLYDCNIAKLDAVLISHLHSDHVGALPEIAENFTIHNLISPEFLKSSIISAKNGKKIATEHGAKFYNAKQGMNFSIGEFEITLLSDFSDKRNENNRSLFVMAKIGKIKFLFTGDAEAKAEKLLLNENLDIDCDILKVSHHGSDTSSTKAFLEASTPEYAVISVGKNNMYGHPDSKILNRLKNEDAEIYRTDQSGDITFFVNNGKVTVTKEYN